MRQIKQPGLFQKKIAVVKGSENNMRHLNNPGFVFLMKTEG
jgi:hypothetical protein